MKRALLAAGLALAVFAVPGMQAPAGAWGCGSGGFSVGLGLNVTLTGHCSYWCSCCPQGPGYGPPQPWNALQAGDGYAAADFAPAFAATPVSIGTSTPSQPGGTGAPSLPAPSPVPSTTPARPTSYYPSSDFGYGSGGYGYSGYGYGGYDYGAGSSYGFTGSGYQSPSYWYGN
jgi:hypothetical protein